MSKLHKLVAGTAVISTIALGYSTIADADTYIVKSGDTLWDIARNNGTTVEQLMIDNHLTSSLIFPGDQLSYSVEVAQVAKAENNGFYTVVAGDTLFKIASKFGTTVDVLAKTNKLANPNFILVGQSLNVSGKVVEEVEVVASNAEVAPAQEVAPAAEAVTQEVAASPVVETVVEEPAVPVAVPVVAEPVAPVATPAVVNVSNKGASILAAARAQLGAFQDCTMLVTNSLRSVGINYHNWPAGYMSLGTVVSADQAQPGDLIYYANGGMGYAHIAVYAGGGQAIHGGWNGNQTVVNTAYLGSGPVFIRVA